MDPAQEMIEVTIRIPLTLWARWRLEAERAGQDLGTWIAEEVARTDSLARRVNAAYADAARAEARMTDLGRRTMEVFEKWKDFLDEIS